MEGIAETISILDNQHIKSLLSESSKIPPFKSLTEHSYGVSSLSYKQNTKCLLSGSFDSSINQYDINSMSLLKKYKEHTDGVWSINQSESSNIFVSSGSDTNILLWDINTGKAINKLSFHDQTVYDVKFSKSNNYLISCSKGKIALWNMKNLSKPMNVIENKEHKFVYSSNILCNDKYILYGLKDGGLVAVDIATSKEVADIQLDFNKFKSEVNLDSENSVSTI